MRLFVAVNLPHAIRHDLWDAAAPLRAAGAPVRWSPPESLHVTLKFLGPVDDGAVEALGTALAGALAEVRAFDLGVGGFGAFPDPRRPRVVWCGVERHPALELLAHDVERALKPFDFPPELRPFNPHVTLGRAEKEAPAKAFTPLKRALKDLAWEQVFPVESVDLMRSTPGSGGSVYDVRQRAALVGAG